MGFMAKKLVAKWTQEILFDNIESIIQGLELELAGKNTRIFMDDEQPEFRVICFIDRQDSFEHYPEGYLPIQLWKWDFDQLIRLYDALRTVTGPCELWSEQFRSSDWQGVCGFDLPEPEERPELDFTIPRRIGLVLLDAFNVEEACA